MTFFDLSLPKSVDEQDPKVHSISFEVFRKAYRDFPRELAERLVELGFGKWAPCGVNGVITTPQAIMPPMEFFFIVLPTNTVKAIHVNDLVPENGPSPNDVASYGANLIKNARFTHAPEDIYDADEYDASLEDDFSDLDTETVELDVVIVDEEEVPEPPVNDAPDPEPEPEKVEEEAPKPKKAPKKK